MMKHKLLVFLLCISFFVNAQSTAWKRAQAIGKGMNLTWMDQRWNGTEENAHRDYIDLADLPYYKKQVELMHQMGYRFLRFPVCFDLWYHDAAPYQLLTPQYYTALDSMVKWTGEKGMMLSIDYHHGKLSSSTVEENKKRIVAIWKEVAKRYSNTDPDRVFFELFNEPYEVSESEWQEVLTELVTVVRVQVPAHTLIVGAAKWNGKEALVNMELVKDTNLIYTFHFYDPFLFTHQGADWVGDAAASTQLPYPYRKQAMPRMSEETRGTWGAAQKYVQYPHEAQYDALFESLNTVVNWSEEHHVPVFCGEWGAYKQYAPVSDRCRYLADVYRMLEQLQIPNAMWEWNGGFSFFEGTPEPENLSPCMKKAMKIGE